MGPLPSCFIQQGRGCCRSLPELPQVAVCAQILVSGDRPGGTPKKVLSVASFVRQTFLGHAEDVLTGTATDARKKGEGRKKEGEVATKEQQCIMEGKSIQRFAAKMRLGE